MYIILPSNSPAVSYPANTSSHFTIPLPFTLLTKTWKVGLTQIQLPITFYNVEEDHKITFYQKDGHTFSVNLREGIYDDPLLFLKMIQNCCQENLEISWNIGFKLVLKEETQKIVLTKKLSRLLGVPEEISDRFFESEISDFDPWINFRVLLVQCSLVKASQVNSSELQVLRALAPQDFTFGQTYTGNFFPVDYFKILGEAHKTITVKISDLDNKPVRFRTGNVILQLELQEA